MDAPTLLRAARQQGVEIQLGNTFDLQIRGPQEALARVKPILAKYRLEVTQHLIAEEYELLRQLPQIFGDDQPSTSSESLPIRWLGAPLPNPKPRGPLPLVGPPWRMLWVRPAYDHDPHVLASRIYPWATEYHHREDQWLPIPDEWKDPANWDAGTWRPKRR
jgi:hypothetical protein